MEQPLVEAEVLPENFVNSAAINIYHDGSEGIQSHYDDASRFARPIVSLRIFSDSRLSFGTRYFGYVNGSFFVPMPRGCVTVMEEDGCVVCPPYSLALWLSTLFHILSKK